MLFLYSAYFTLSQKRMIMAAAWARVAVASGVRAPFSSPSVRPDPQAHWKADIAYSLMLVASTSLLNLLLYITICTRIVQANF